MQLISRVVIMVLAVIDNGFCPVSWCTVPSKAIKRDLAWLVCSVFVNSFARYMWTVVHVMMYA